MSDESEERKEEFWTAVLKISGIILLVAVIVVAVAHIWPLPQLFGHRSFWRNPVNVAAEKSAATPAASKATLDAIAKDLAAIKGELFGKPETNDSEGAVPGIKELLTSQIKQSGNFPWFYLARMNENTVWLTPNAPANVSPDNRPCQEFALDRVAFVSFVEKEGGIARRLTEEDAEGESLLLSVVAWGREEAEEGDGYVVGLILADVGPPETPLSYQVKVGNATVTMKTTVGKRSQQLVYELLEKEKKEAKKAESVEDSAE